MDSPLTELGVAQALAQHEILKKQNLEGVTAFCSPQGRAFQTASIAMRGLLPAIETDSRLREIGVGDWQGHLVSDVPVAGILDESDESVFDLYERAPGGEGFAALKDRCHAFLMHLSGPAIVVTHGITSRMLRLILLGQHISEMGSLPGGQGVVYHLKDGVQFKLTIGA